MLAVTVVRSRWLRGEGSAYSKLLRHEDQKMCCIGFACIEAGLTPSDIETYSELCQLETEGVVDVVPLALEKLLDSDEEETINSRIADQLYQANDNESLHDGPREEKLIALGKEANILFTFVD